MKTFRLASSSTLLALSLLASAQSDPQLVVTAQFSTFDNDLSHVIDSAFYQDVSVTGPLSIDKTEVFNRGTSVTTGVARVTADYGQINAYAHTEIVHQEDAAYYDQVGASGDFFDPLTITDGIAGGTIEASLRLTGLGSVGANPGQSHWEGYLMLNFYIQDPLTLNWGLASQTDLDVRESNHDAVVDETLTGTLTNYDPTRKYALLGLMSAGASLFAIPSDQNGDVPWSEFDASHTATLDHIGFVGGSGTFVGASGHVYPGAVPEPASLIALGAGLLAMRRRKRA